MEPSPQMPQLPALAASAFLRQPPANRQMHKLNQYNIALILLLFKPRSYVQKAHNRPKPQAMQGVKKDPINKKITFFPADTPKTMPHQPASKWFSSTAQVQPK